MNYFNAHFVKEIVKHNNNKNTFVIWKKSSNRFQYQIFLEHVLLIQI